LAPSGILSVMKRDQLNQKMQEFRDEVRSVCVADVARPFSLASFLSLSCSFNRFPLSILFYSSLCFAHGSLKCHAQDDAGQDMATTGGASRRGATGRSGIKTSHNGQSSNTSMVNCCSVFVRALPLEFGSVCMFMLSVQLGLFLLLRSVPAIHSSLAYADSTPWGSPR
jgi:hypothetical protein